MYKYERKDREEGSGTEEKQEEYQHDQKLRWLSVNSKRKKQQEKMDWKMKPGCSQQKKIKEKLKEIINQIWKGEGWPEGWKEGIMYMN